MENDASRDDARSSTPGGAPPTPATPRPATRRRRWPFVLAGLVVAVVLAFAAWTWIALSYSYSNGERAGYIQKFSQKGWVCKTWEGELAMVNVPGAAQERFLFSVRDDSVAAQITKLMGSRVAISYAQHKGVPTRCFGETEYYVTAVKGVAAAP